MSKVEEILQHPWNTMLDFKIIHIVKAYFKRKQIKLQ